MTVYRVEAHDNHAWSFGVRMNHDRGVPVFCDLRAADLFTSRADAEMFCARTIRLCGGTLRVNRVRAAAES